MLGAGMHPPGNLLKIVALCVAALLAAFPAQAQETPPPEPIEPIEPAERSWRLGAALGYGVRTNPLIQSDDIPLIVDVDLAWFGKRWFFDNGDLGFQLLDRPAHTTNVVARVNSDRVFFGKTNTRYVNFAYAGRGELAAMVDPQTGELLEAQVEVDPPDRDYAIELGLETLFGGEWGAAGLRAFHDVSGTHRGYEISADYSFRWTSGRLSLSPSIGIAYKSSNLNDYYWGVQRDEASLALREYHPHGGFALEVGMRASYYFTKNLRLALAVNMEKLPGVVSMSPLARDDYVFGYFSGLAWAF